MAPELHHEQRSASSTAAPHNGIGAVIADGSDADSAVRALRSAGYYGSGVSVFAGQEGLDRLDLKAEVHGVEGHLRHAAQALFTDKLKFYEGLESALKQGKYYLTVQTDGSAEQKKTVQSILKAHDGHQIRFFGMWATEQL